MCALDICPSTRRQVRATFHADGPDDSTSETARCGTAGAVRKPATRPNTLSESQIDALNERRLDNLSEAIGFQYTQQLAVLAPDHALDRILQFAPLLTFDQPPVAHQRMNMLIGVTEVGARRIQTRQALRGVLFFCLVGFSLCTTASRPS